MSTEKMREEFEAWMRDTAKVVVGSSHPYSSGLERDYWRVWQASRAAVLVELPSHYCYDNPGEAYGAMSRYPWIKTPQTVQYCVMHCVSQAPGYASHFQYQLETMGRVFTIQQVSSALQRLKKAGLVENIGVFWQVPGAKK